MLVKVAASNAIKYPSIGIVGAGIGGLTTANALLHKGNLVDRVEIFDQAAEFYPTAGAAFGFSANGQICFSSIGIDNYHQYGHPFNSMTRIDKSGTVIRLESSALGDLRDKYGFGINGFLRSDIVDILVDHLEKTYSHTIRYSHKLSKISQVHDRVELEFENGHKDVFDLVIGADGIHSTVAKQLKIDDGIPPIYANANIFYGKIPKPNELEYFQNSEIFKDNRIVNGPGTGEYLNFFAGTGEKKHFVWANTYAADAPPPKRDEWNHGHRDELGAILSQFPEGHPIHDLADMTTDDNILHFGLYYRHHKKSWTDGRVVLLGDACHATLPYVGQGANQAIEDAIYLADCLERHGDYEAAYKDFYDVRFPRTKRIVQIAGVLNRVYHSESWFVKKARDFLLDSLVQGGAVFKQIEKEILEECPVKDYQRYVPQ